jgi:hypothetical protein
MDEREFQARVRQIDSLVEQVQGIRDESVRGTTIELVRAILDVHAAGLARVLEVGSSVVPALVKDDMIASLLLLHGLHPATMEERVVQALDKLEPYLRRRGATAHLISISDGVVRIKVDGAPLTDAVEEAVYALAPEAAQVIVDGPAAVSSGFVPLSSLVAP